MYSFGYDIAQIVKHLPYEKAVVRIFPNSDACRRLVRALVVETHENWLEAHRYLKMNDLKELKKTQFRQAA